MALALNYDKIDKIHQRISKIRSFIDQYNWKDIDYPATSKDWKKFEQIMNRLLLIFYTCLIILEKYILHTNQDII